MNLLELNTSKLKLSLVEQSDLIRVHHLHSLPETDEFNTLGIPKNIEETKALLNSWVLHHQSKPLQHYIFKIEQTTTHQFMGLIALNLGNPKFRTGEVWYKLQVEYWGQGFATEALSRILDFAFKKLKLHRVEAGCAVDNIGSRKVLEKVGMLREGRKRQVLPLKSGWSDNFIYAIIETDPRLPSTATALTP